MFNKIISNTVQIVAGYLLADFVIKKINEYEIVRKVKKEK